MNKIGPFKGITSCLTRSITIGVLFSIIHIQSSFAVTIHNIGEYLDIQFGFSHQTIPIYATDETGSSVSFSLEAGADGLTIDPVTGLLDWTPNLTHLGGIFPVKVCASTDNGGYDSIEFSLRVLRNFYLSGTPVDSIYAGNTYDFTPVVVGTSGYAYASLIEFQLLSDADWLSIDPATGRVTGRAVAGAPTMA